MPLTKRQKEILDFIHSFIAEHGYAPSFEEIAHSFGYSSLATVHEHLSNLERKGYIRKSYNESRSIEMVPDESGPSAMELPLMGAVAAGVPIEASVDQEGRILLPSGMRYAVLVLPEHDRRMDLAVLQHLKMQVRSGCAPRFAHQRHDRGLGASDLRPHRGGQRVAERHQAEGREQARRGAPLVLLVQLADEFGGELAHRAVRAPGGRCARRLWPCSSRRCLAGSCTARG